MLLRRRCNDLRLARVVDDGGARDPDLTFGGDDTPASVAEAIAIGGYWNGWVCDYMIRNGKVGCARVVNIQHQHHRRRLRTVVDQLVAHPDLHNRPPLDPGLSRLVTLAYDARGSKTGVTDILRNTLWSARITTDLGRLTRTDPALFSQ